MASSNHDQDERLRQTAIQFWQQEAALDGNQALKRADFLTAAILDGDKIVATASVVPSNAPPVYQPLLQFRAYVKPQMRRQGLASTLLSLSSDQLEEIYTPQQQSGEIGIILVLNEQQAKNVNPYRYWPKTKFSYIGKDDNNHILMVRYFEKSRLTGAMIAD